MYFDEYGDRNNKTVILLHGAAATDSFSNQYCFSKKVHLVVPHLYGSGKEVDKIYHSQQTIQDLAELIKNFDKDKVSLIGHSLGAELSVALVSNYENLFDKAVFLSAWVCSSEKSAQMYAKMAKLTCMNLKWGWLVRQQAKYWNYTSKQADFMVEYSKKITSEQYKAWFLDRIQLDRLANYKNVQIPMLAICGEKEVKEMRHSIEELGRQNLNCKTMIIKKANHDFPMRFAAQLNPILLEFLSK